MPRRYCQVDRARSASKTREHIVAAARQCLLDLGYQKMRVADVAKAAGVARASVFRHFRNKAEILRAVEADAAERAGVMQLVESLGKLPPLDALRAVLRDGSRIWAKEARIFQQFYGTAPFDDTLRPLVLEKEALRRSLVRGLVAQLDRTGLLRAGWHDTRSVTNALWLLTGFETFDALTRVRGLSSKAATNLIEQIVCCCFLKTRGGRKGT